MNELHHEIKEKREQLWSSIHNYVHRIVENKGTFDNTAALEQFIKSDIDLLINTTIKSQSELTLLEFLRRIGIETQNDYTNYVRDEINIELEINRHRHQ